MAFSQAFLEWEEKTKQKGLEQGLEHERSLVIRQLTRKIGPLAPTFIASIRVLSFSQIESLGEALLDFEQPADLQDWLEKH